MKVFDVTLDDLQAILEELNFNYPKFKVEDLFVLWFLLAYVTDDEQKAADSVTNGPNDAGLDAIFIDDAAHLVCLVQGKYGETLGKKNEKRNDLMDLAHKAQLFEQSKSSEFKELIANASPAVASRLRDARTRIQKNGYRLSLYYVCLGKCSTKLRKEAENAMRTVTCESSIDIISSKNILKLVRDYLDGVAPPIPSVGLEMERGAGIGVNGIYQRYDNRSKIESWVFSMRGDAIADLVETYRKRLFARNIRGFLGEATPVNRAMKNTLTTEPSRFFYYNNGLTFICDEAEKTSAKGKDILRVTNPQIINGLQTATMLRNEIERAGNASVIVKVVQIPRDTTGGGEEFDSLISHIVAGTNWQNAIRPPDLMSNDRRQIEIERELRKFRYLYLRKRQSKSEAKNLSGGKYFWAVYKEDLARTVAGCDLDPIIVRSGKDKLFEEELYSQVFPNSDPYYYLPRYWLGREVSFCSKGYPERGYAKWLVLNYVWSRLASIVRTKKYADAFRVMAERKEADLVAPLRRAIAHVYQATLRNFRANRGIGEKALDISTYFRNTRGLDREFQRYWVSNKNTNLRKDFARSWEKVRDAVQVQEAK